MTSMTSESRAGLAAQNRRAAALPQWQTSSADVRRGILAERIRAVRHWVITASVAGTVAFSMLAAIHTAGTAAATTTTGATTTGTVAQSSSSTSTGQTSLFGSGTSSSVSLGSSGSTSIVGTQARTATS